MHRAARLADRVAARGEVQEGAQEHHDQPDGCAGSGQRAAGNVPHNASRTPKPTAFCTIFIAQEQDPIQNKGYSWQ